MKYFEVTSFSMSSNCRKNLQNFIKLSTVKSCNSLYDVLTSTVFKNQDGTLVEN